jgi:hypothetical protein
VATRIGAKSGGGRRQKILVGVLGLLALVFVVRMMGGGGGDGGGESSSETQPGGPSATVVVPQTPTPLDIVPAPDLSGIPSRNPFERVDSSAGAGVSVPTDPTAPSGRPDTGAA